ncbi:MAG: hypothetical protein JWN14_1387 [Chthonomonadales bacterium]|nr:hypothetical protein [Chthonomonadales bacterium]
MRNLFKRFYCLMAATGTVIIGGLCTAQQSVKPADSAEFARYRQWIKVNPKPVRFTAGPAGLCAMANSQMLSPHRDKFITVYVNPVAKKAMLEDRNPKFPVGTVLVKEKCSTATSKTPELMTVMRKHEAGYDTKNGDWEYLVLEGASGKVQVQGDVTKCQGCHRQQGFNDFVFRTPYLSAAQFKQLKPASGKASLSD